MFDYLIFVILCNILCIICTLMHTLCIKICSFIHLSTILNIQKTPHLDNVGHLTTTYSKHTLKYRQIDITTYRFISHNNIENCILCIVVHFILFVVFFFYGIRYHVWLRLIEALLFLQRGIVLLYLYLVYCLYERG